MDHIAIDLGGRKSQICIRAADGAIRAERSIDTDALKLFFKSEASARVVMETCSESITVAAWARDAGHDVRIVPATLAPSLGVGARGVKTDIRDARALSEASCRMPDLPSVHLRSELARNRQALLGMRSALVNARTLLINSVKGWGRTLLLRLRPHKAASFADAVEEKLLASPSGMPTFVARQLSSIRELTNQIKSANAELEKIAETDAVCRRLASVPGVGPTTAVCFYAVVDTPARFASAHALTSYLGLTPGEDSSSGRVRRTGITKAGPPMLRQLLTQCAWSIWIHQSQSPMGQWAAKIAERRGKRVAIVALARKLAGIMYALWRDGSDYDATATADTPTTSAHRANRRQLMRPAM